MSKIKMTNKDIALVIDRDFSKPVGKNRVLVCAKMISQDEEYPTFALLHEAQDMVWAKRWVRSTYPKLEWAGSPQEEVAK